MAIARYENVTVQNVTTTTTNMGDQTTTLTNWFTSRAKVADVSNSLRIAERYRVYSDLVNLTFNYTPNTKEVIRNPHMYSITWSNFDWRIDNVREADDRMTVNILCVRNDPVVAV